MNKQANSNNPFANFLWWIMWFLTMIPAGIGLLLGFETILIVQDE